MPSQPESLNAAALAAKLARLTLALDLHGWDDQALTLEKVVGEVAASAGIVLDAKLWDAAAAAPKGETARELVALVEEAVRRAAVLLGRDPAQAAADWGAPVRQPHTPSPARAVLLDRVTPQNVHPDVPVAVADSEPHLSLADLLTYAAFVLGSVEEAKEWLSEPHQLLGNRSPAEVAGTSDGARRVKRLLDGLDWSLPL
jgi:hypothetical protein